MLKPLHDQVILKKEEVEKKTTSGIILTTETKKLPSIGKVIAKGPKCESEIQANDKVVYKEYSGTSITVNDEDFIVIKEEDILAIVE